MGNKLCPKIILEGTRLTFKTEIAFELNEHPRFVGPRKYRYTMRCRAAFRIIQRIRRGALGCRAQTGNATSVENYFSPMDGAASASWRRSLESRKGPLALYEGDLADRSPESHVIVRG